MQEFEVPEAKEPASMPIAGIFPCRDLVIRRAGGLEELVSAQIGKGVVIRRAGGLEVIALALLALLIVIRRAGGLEDHHAHCKVSRYVIRRAGGLEVIALALLAYLIVIRRAGGLEEQGKVRQGKCLPCPSATSPALSAAQAA